MMDTLAVLVVGGSIWLALGFICGLRIVGRLLDGKDATTILLLVLVTHFVGLSLVWIGGMIWAAWIILSAPFKLVRRLFPAPAAPVAPVPVRTLPPPLPPYSYNSTRYTRH